ncbi:MAG: alkaline phosphatase family protein, partial [Gemmatimonadetes bacterium]|nr:alkaline phosphatase family protein [Gemmatimonadota bacterium]
WRFLFVVYPGPDGIIHHTEPRDSRVLESYRRIDAALGAFMERALERGEAPVLMVVADHGATVMREHRDIAVALENWGVPTLRHPAHVWRRDARAAVMVSGNASVQIYFSPRSGRHSPLLHDEMPMDLVERLVSLDAVRLAACRDRDGSVLVLAGSERARLRERADRIEIEAIQGDPLGLGGSAVLEDAVVLARSRTTDVPDAARQLLQLFRTARAGDLVLAAHRDFDFRGPWEIPEHKAGHGSLIAEHMEIPLLASVPLPPVAIRTVDIMPAILELLGVAIPDTIDGVPFSVLDAQESGIR